ncbi:purine-nucleoside phosphorylase [Salinibacter sp. 10B]|uniref:purine-nucleoside phosphorylase n=1 Tax=Salinibacter sp. 10B TaxID=1923971 RepID=UPI000D289957|nr:purine-nucleoside phosphorylase [Salinibacter sp. 10B]PQJ36015.1 purine-nucleoside phosphorylase [Salinibacter sp. 10B]
MYTKSSPEAYDQDLSMAVDMLRERVARAPEMALILGSGLGGLAEAASNTTVVNGGDIPGYPASTVEGHEGRLIFGMLEDTSVVFVQGRVHLYEGYPVQTLTMPVRLVHALGAEQMVVTNSAGGINRTFQPGTLMLITGHLNVAFASPGVGAGVAPWHRANADAEELEGDYYDAAWTDRAERAALDLGVDVRRGVYAWMLGPNYETPAEIRALDRMGADAVGMSTVPEVLQAQMLGMQVVGLSTITNPAAGLAAGELDHDDVLDVGQRVRGDLMTLVRRIVRVAEG